MMSQTKRDLDALLAALRTGKPKALEQLGASFLGWLLNVQVYIASGGFQYGGDAGTAGRQNRHLRVEAKRYSDSTPLSNRDLQGEVMDARRRKESLEAWILVSTIAVSETTLDTLDSLSEETGVPIILFDWTEPAQGIPDLALLCASAPEFVERFYGTAAAEVARRLPRSPEALERIRKDLQPWRIGFSSLQEIARQRIRAIWSTESESRAALAQNVAGAAHAALIRRTSVHEQLKQWWAGPKEPPLAVFGQEGVGKTWSVVHWIVESLDTLPITLLLPATSIAEIKGLSESSLIGFLAQLLHSLARSRTEGYWQQRLFRLLERPLEEDASLLLMIDGLNEDPTFEWGRLLQILQGGVFRGRVRIILTTQTHFFENDLRGLSYLSFPAQRLGVEPYDQSPNGELDQLLAPYGCTQSDLPDDLLALARIARMFPLVMKFRSEASFKGDATVNRLLWAYGRDELRMREGRAFSEQEWGEWLVELAQKFLGDIQQTGHCELPRFSNRQLSATTSLAHREAKHNARRLSEIVEGQWMEAVPGAPHSFRPKQHTISLALAVDLLGHLESVPANEVDSALTRWIDPISATGWAADVLAAALSILVARQGSSHITSSILTALLHSQNAKNAHRDEIRALAPVLIDPLLQTLERSRARTQASTRKTVREALKGVSVDHSAGWQTMFKRMASWLAYVRCPTQEQKDQADAETRALSARLIQLLGTDEPGTVEVLGVLVRLHPWDDNDLANEVPALLQGRPLASAPEVFLAACVARAIDHRTERAWEGLYWLSMLNPVDRAQTVAALVALADRITAPDTQETAPTELRQQAAGIVLHLTGVEAHQLRGYRLRGNRPNGHTYANDYLPNPARSLFALERRHADQVLNDHTMLPLVRLQRARAFLPDPGVSTPPSLAHALHEIAEYYDVTQLDSGPSYNVQDYQFKEFRAGAARFTPEALRWVVRNQLHGLQHRAGESRHWAALRSSQYLLLVGPTEAQAAQRLRLNKPNPPDPEEAFVISLLLQLEFLHATPEQQLELLIQESSAPIPLTLMACSQPMLPDALSRFIATHSLEDLRTAEVLFNYLAQHGTPLAEDALKQLLPFALESRFPDIRPLAYIGLYFSNPHEFARALWSRHWGIAPEQSMLEKEYGSRALLVAVEGQALEEDVAARIAPWLLLSASRIRGSALDAKRAARAIDAALRVLNFDPEQSPADIVLDATDPRSQVSFHARPGAEQDNPIERMKWAFDFEAQTHRQQQAHSQGLEYLGKARAAGAHLYTQMFPVEDIQFLLKQCSAEIDAWLDGMDECTDAFRRRVNLAGGFFLTLCESLLESESDRGVRLWHSLSQVLKMKIVGVAGIDELEHIVFRVRQSPQVQSLRDELYSLRRCSTDERYLELAICALANGGADWLDDRIRQDERSGVDWRILRAIMLRGFSECPSIDDLEWHEGPVQSTWATARYQASQWRNRHALARYWWTQFLSASTPEEAYTAWEVFLTCADRRAWVWIAKDCQNGTHIGPSMRLKILHVMLNLSTLKQAMGQFEKEGVARMDSHLMGWTPPATWLDLQSIKDGSLSS